VSAVPLTGGATGEDGRVGADGVTPAESATPEELAAAANGALDGGALAEAVDLFERSARAHLRAGRPPMASHGFRLAAAVALTLGQPARAAELAGRAVRQAGGAASRFAALVTLAEAERHGDRPGDAVGSLTEALDLTSSTAGVATALEVAAVLRRRAGLQHGLGRVAAAVADLTEATGLLVEAAEDGSAADAQVELAGLLADRSPERARAALVAARRLATGAAAVGVLAKVDVAEGSLALAAGDDRAAEAGFVAGRDRALEAVDPATYIAAASGAAAAAVRAGDRVRGYGHLAAGWVTVSDLLGGEVAAEAFRPQLERLRAAWGPTAFAAVRAAHDDARRDGRPLS
jgi:hypothetical protein